MCSNPNQRVDNLFHTTDQFETENHKCTTLKVYYGFSGIARVPWARR